MAPQFPFVLNAIAGAHSITDEAAAAIVARLRTAVETAKIDWLAPGRAFDIGFDGDPDSARAALRGVRDDWLLDLNVLPSDGRRKKLLIADMDSTIIGCECIDELADMAGIKPKVAAITERAMRGEIEFPCALRERVGLLKGLPLEVLGARLCRTRASQSGRARRYRDHARAWRAHAAGLRWL